MIVIGYQGIGKSSLAGKNHKYIDLESGNFWVDGKRAEDWYKPYCQIAEHLSQQGYVVFTSSHEVVRGQLRGTSEDVILVFPSLALKDEWIAKLQNRFDITGSEKDLRALLNAVDRYQENIEELKSDDFWFGIAEIDSMDYDLEQMIEEVLNE